MWFPLALITAVIWGAGDVFAKRGTDPRDKYSHWRMVVMVGAVMGIHAIILLVLKFRLPGFLAGAQQGVFSLFGASAPTQGYDPMNLIRYLPVSACYIVSMIFGYVALRYLEVSVSSPVCNSSGAIVAILCFVFLKQTIEWPQVVAIFLVALGIILLSVFDLKDENKARTFRGEVIEEKYQVSFLAICLPFLYCIIDALGTFGDAIVLDGDVPMLTEDEANIAYELTFLLCAIAAFIFLKWVKKQKFTLWEEREKGLGALCETAGQFAYVYAVADNAIMAAPLVSSYCLFSVVFSRIFLKEKLTVRQYAAIFIALCGIIIMGVYDA